MTVDEEIHKGLYEIKELGFYCEGGENG